MIFPQAQKLGPTRLGSNLIKVQLSHNRRKLLFLVFLAVVIVVVVFLVGGLVVVVVSVVVVIIVGQRNLTLKCGKN